ncbi:hypothetical protein [Pseudomonas putida]|uniref:Uncharacterized protein n=1 Tax=Pseudomonas putida TaxID=303 RepID=A0A8I1JHS5_PSEPU|nr:hypothetical protein [Pseudomonas putida]MBI6882981.1 hypothetical protein [Pseudomonas putida]
MQIIPLKNKYGLTEDDINNLSALIVDGRSLEELFEHFQDKMNIEQIFIAAGILAREMFDMSLQELSPDLIAERRRLSQDKHDEWESKRNSQQLLGMIRNFLEDLSLLELELQVAAAKS